MSFQPLFAPVEHVDAWLAGLLAGTPFVVALLIALVLGLRHASDPDHLVAVTSLVAADGGKVRSAAGLGAWWGAGHAAALLAVGVPLILLKSSMPAWLERGAETAVGVIILVLALRIVVGWARGIERPHRRLRTPHQALGIGVLHGLAGTGAVTVLLIAALPGKLEAAAALAVFAPMSAVSMTLCTTAFTWVLTRPPIEPLYRTVLIPALGSFGLVFGAWYMGIG